ncbi:putative LRR receptor-like serine/threonine-protein kinase [Raphanus sativus]|uniref:non-specific serine/threonine protein kinase n=1 Tax=Raphanus sativus TaxID=3726 RepID=A0A6J0LQ67_RAPSA|nr:probable LRR receptor-like serine/threonine-protein kinase At5g59680 [Raphanus sativus]KAJ4911033.1 putative LRR receptor-like serine/threonine-protein kinase [Raphanus sativus]
MESSLVLWLMLIATLAIFHSVQSQDQQGFISLDCGLPANEQSPYIETNTGLNFSSDATFIQGGKTGKIQASSVGRLMKPYTTVRYFPDGTRNCYSLNVQSWRRHLIRATFTYGNYDGLNIQPVFDLYLGPNRWATIDLETMVNGSLVEILHKPTSNSLQVCLVKTGKTIPLISTLELRPVENGCYISNSSSLNLHHRSNLIKSGSNLRYSNDTYDRVWESYFKMEWNQISTTLDVDNSNKYEPPKDALKVSATPTNASAPLTIEWSSANPDAQYYLYAHFAEIQDLQANQTREFNSFWNGELYHGPLTPPKLSVTTLFSKSPRTCDGGKCSVQLIRTNISTLPPLLNAYEVYTVIKFPQSETEETDVSAIRSIAASYALSRINWQGDPCVPQRLRWDGLNCTNTVVSIPPRITTLNLSSSGLTGTIAAAIQSLTQLEILDLSNNNLTGEVPEFLGNMQSLLVINLRGNNLNGSLPQALQRKGLELFVKGNPGLRVSDSSRKQLKNKVSVPIVASVASAAVVITVLVLFLVFRKKRSKTVEDLPPPQSTPTVNDTFANNNSRKFTYSEVIKMTNNFQRVLGKGGFGMVYHGSINGSEQVAVKLLSQSSTQGYKEFKAEVDLLLRVHHTNLVSLVGYCFEGHHLALIYEFMPNGDLKQHLSGNEGRSIINWRIRLQIALEAALGLEYLHTGCTPPMVHRDVKTANILLDESFKAKLADFGLSRSFQGGNESHELTVIAGTHGYLDPEYVCTRRLAEKSDVYGYGVVLLEMITNQPVISEKCHITEWVGSTLKRGDITNIMDPNLGGAYDSNSAWRAVELAMACADPFSSKRPTMSQVISELKDCIVCENSRINNNGGLEPQQMSIVLDTSVGPGAR